MSHIQHKQQNQFGPYTALKVIGTSAQGAVYAARHQTTGKMVALRVLHIVSKDVGEVLNQCLAVLNNLSQIRIPNGVQAHDFGNEGASLYIAMDILKGGTLYQRMQSRIVTADTPELPSPDDVLAITERISTALDALHQIGMVHGQIQPHNIMFDENGNAFLMDIGLTRIFKIIYSLDTTNSFHMSRYTPPELWLGERPSPATDQYALACVVYQLLTGRVPFKGNSIFALMEAHQNDVATPPHYIDASLSQDLAPVFWQAFAKPIDRRYPNVRSFYLELQECFGDETPHLTDFTTFSLD